MPRSRASGCAIWRVGAAPAPPKAVWRPRAERALRDGRATPRHRPSPPLSRRAPERPARAPESAVSWHQSSSPPDGARSSLPCDQLLVDVLHVPNGHADVELATLSLLASLPELAPQSCIAEEESDGVRERAWVSARY